MMYPIDFHSMGKIPGKSVGTNPGLITDILQNIFFCVQQKYTNISRQREDHGVDNIMILKARSHQHGTSLIS